MRSIEELRFLTSDELNAAVRKLGQSTTMQAWLEQMDTELPRHPELPCTATPVTTEAALRGAALALHMQEVEFLDEGRAPLNCEQLLAEAKEFHRKARSVSAVRASSWQHCLDMLATRGTILETRTTREDIREIAQKIVVVLDRWRQAGRVGYNQKKGVRAAREILRLLRALACAGYVVRIGHCGTALTAVLVLSELEDNARPVTTLLVPGPAALVDVPSSHL